MDPELKAKIRQWKAGMEAGNQMVLEEKRNRTPAERMRLLQAFLDGHGQIAIAASKPEARLHKMPYSEIQARMSAHYAKRNAGNGDPETTA